MSSEPFSQLKPSTLVSQAAAQLLQYIDGNQLVAGDCLPSIATMSEQLGASKAVIRESLKSLEARGIIEIANGRRARIKPVTSEPLLSYFHRAMQVDKGAANEFAEIRMALEMQGVSLAVRRASDEELAALPAIVQQMRKNIANPEVFTELDVRFHLSIAQATHNTMLLHLLDSLRDAITESVRKGLHRRLTPLQMETVQQFHERVVETLLARDEAGAVEAMHAHFDEIALSLD